MADGSGRRWASGILSGLTLAALVGTALLWLVLFGVGGLTAVFTWLFTPLVLPLVGGLGLALAVLSLVLDRSRWWLSLGAGLASLLACVPVLQLVGWWQPAWPASLEGTEPAATVRLPLDGPVRVAWGGDTRDVNYHVFSPDQRWAYDLLVEPGGHGSDQLADYGCYGLPVLAPTDATVAHVHTGEPDQVPGQLAPNLTAPGGNFVALELPDTGTYLLLAHLKPGSVAVQEGQSVAEGEVLGACGNSGNTSEPHVHIHHQRQAPIAFGIGEGLPLYFRDHDGPPMPQGGVEIEGEEARFVGDVVEHMGE